MRTQPVNPTAWPKMVMKEIVDDHIDALLEEIPIISLD
jgi:hypothetical protein